MAKRLYSSSFSYQQLADLHFAKVGFQQSKKDTSISGNIPIGEVVIGGDYDESTYKSRQEQIVQTQRWDTRIEQSIDSLLATGDKEVLQAWTDCMRNRGGLSIRFTSIQPKSAVAVIEWFASAGVTDVELVGPFAPPMGVRVANGGECLRPVKDNGVKFVTNTNGCRVQFEFDSATTPLLISLNAAQGRGSADAYLPPRVVLRKYTRPYNFSNSGRPEHCQTAPHLAISIRQHSAGSVSRSYCSDSKNGWTFDRKSFTAATSIDRNYEPAKHGAWLSGTYTAADTQMIAVLTCSSSSKHYITCHGDFTVEEAKWVWEEAGDKIGK